VGAAGQLDEPVSLRDVFPRDGFLGLATGSSVTCKGASGPALPVLVIDNLVTAVVRNQAGHGLGEGTRVRDVLAGRSRRLLRDHAAHARPQMGCARALVFS
jgi:hypothetical protein